MLKKAFSFIAVFSLLIVTAMPLNSQAQDDCRQLLCLDGTTGETESVCSEFASEKRNLALDKKFLRYQDNEGYFYSFGWVDSAKVKSENAIVELRKYELNEVSAED